MKKMNILLIVLLMLFSLVSCKQYQENNITVRDKEIAERNIVDVIGFTSDNMMYNVADLNSIEAITEISTQIILCRVDKVEEVFMTEINLLRFIYDVTIEEIYMDVNNMLKIGDTVKVSTAKGIIKGRDFNKIAGNSAHAQKFGYANKNYEDNEYIVSSSFGGIPVEEGKTYIMYLTDRYFENEKLYAETGRQFIYEYSDGVLYQGLDYEKMDINIIKLKEQITRNIKNRTGRADEIGFDNYIDELGEMQRTAQIN